MIDLASIVKGLSVSDWTSEGAGLLVLRCVFGVLTFTHGYQKWGTMDKFQQSWGLSLPVALAVATVQTLGGLAIILGLLTQLAALANAVVNAAILHALIVKGKEPFLVPGRHSWSIGLAYLGMALTLTIAGGGSLAVDQLFW